MGVYEMATGQRESGAIRKGKTRFSSALAVSLACLALLMLQSGCQEQTRGTKAPGTQTTSDEAVEISKTGQPQQAAVGQSSSPAPAEDGPVITVENAVYDFGEIGPGTAHAGKFKFTNTGTAPLIITQVRSCCGVVTRGVKSGQEYAPGQSGVLELDYQASTLPGDVKRNLHIYSNDPQQSVLALTIQAKIVRRVGYEPTSLKLFLKKDNAGAKDITLTSLDGKPFSVTGFRATAGSVTVDFDPAVQATKFVLKAKVDMEKLEGNLRGQIRITVTHPECKEITMLYDVLPEFTVSPPQIMLFNLKPGQTVRREIWVLGNYEEDFEIESVSSQKGLIKLVESKKVKGTRPVMMGSAVADSDEQNKRIVTRYQLQIDVTPPPAESSRVVLSDILEVKIKGGDTVPVQCRGFYSGN
jgi:hypothetical protein